MAHTIAGASLQELRRFPEAETELRAALQELPGDPDAQAHLGALALALGRRDEALRILGGLDHLPGGEPSSAYSVACLRPALGQKEQARLALEAAVGQRSSDIPVLNVDSGLPFPMASS